MAFEIGNGVLKKYKPEKGETKVVIPDGVTSIGNSAFKMCWGIKEVILPDSVTSIGIWAFADCINLEKINIPDSVKIIEDRAFESCSSLGEIHIPEQVISIGEYAFFYCLGLREIYIPELVESIGDKAFQQCANLREIKVSDKNKSYSSVDGVLFNKDKTELIRCPERKNAFIIPDTVTIITEDAFNDCDNLEVLEIPKSVKSIGRDAFGESYWLEHYPEDLVIVGDGVLVEYKGDADKLIIPNTVKSIVEGAFWSCEKLNSVTINGVIFKPDVKKLLKDYDKAVEMLETKDFSAKIYTSLKNAMIIGHYIQTGDEDAEAFIKKGCLRIFKWLIDEEDIPTIYALINTHKFVNAKNIDKLFEHANQKSNAELKLIFMNYKHEHIGMTKKKELKI